MGLCLWLGILLFSSFSPFCTFLSVIDQFGDHLLSCSLGPSRMQCSNALVCIVHQTLLTGSSLVFFWSKAFHLTNLVLVTYFTLISFLVFLLILICLSEVSLSLLSYLLLLLSAGVAAGEVA